MSQTVEELYCADCRQRVHTERIPVRTAGPGSTRWVNGRIRCLTPECFAQNGVVDRDGNPVKV